MNTTLKIRTCLYGLMFAALVGPLNAFSVSGSGNGGDICEDRIKTIKDDIASWINKGGSAGLHLPPGVSLEQYNAGMVTQIAKAQVSCTNDRVMVENAEKTCKNFIDPKFGSQLVCNRNLLMNDTSDSDQYVLIHHEYAGLAGLEVSDGGDSIYPISNQISGYLENQIIKRLVVSPSSLNATFSCTASIDKDRSGLEKDKIVLTKYTSAAQTGASFTADFKSFHFAVNFGGPLGGYLHIYYEGHLLVGNAIPTLAAETPIYVLTQVDGRGVVLRCE